MYNIKKIVNRHLGYDHSTQNLNIVNQQLEYDRST